MLLEYHNFWAHFRSKGDKEKLLQIHMHMHKFAFMILEMFIIWRDEDFSVHYMESDIGSEDSVSSKMFTIRRGSLYRTHTIWRVHCTTNSVALDRHVSMTLFL